MALIQNLLSKVKIVPWLQFVGCWVASLSLLAWALSFPGALASAARLVALAGVLVSLVSSVVSILSPDPKVLSLKSLLQVGGLLASLAGAFMLSHGQVFAVLSFLGLAVSQAGQWYRELYP